jgi:hypothetical protein
MDSITTSHSEHIGRRKYGWRCNRRHIVTRKQTVRSIVHMLQVQADCIREWTPSSIVDCHPRKDRMRSVHTGSRHARHLALVVHDRFKCRWFECSVGRWRGWCTDC